MKLAEALILLDRLSMEQSGRRLESIERAILTSAWQKTTYRDLDGYPEQTIKNRAVIFWRYLTKLLDTKVNKNNICQVLAAVEIDRILPDRSSQPAESSLRVISRFYGRSKELWRLQYAIATEGRKLIFIYGMKGIGKTTIARQIAERLSDRWERVIWISLQHTPPLIDILNIISKELVASKQGRLSGNLTKAIDKTIEQLNTQRCLLVFDNADGIVDRAEESLNSGLWSDYANFFNRIDREKCNVCCLTILSAKLSPNLPDYYQIEIPGLDRPSCQRIVASSDLSGTPMEWDILIAKYRGNPQYIKIVAHTIRDIFNGDIGKFLDANILIFDRIENSILEQIERLSDLELSIIKLMMKEREPIPLERLRDCNKYLQTTDRQLIITLDRLVRQYLIEVEENYFKLPDAIAEQLELSIARD